jgi:soluble cytochrome b562
MLEINTSVLKNTVTFSVDRNSMKTALDAFDQIQKKAKGIKDPTINMKRFSQGLKSAERELDKLNKKASKPRSNDEREKARAAKARRVELRQRKRPQETHTP